MRQSVRRAGCGAQLNATELRALGCASPFTHRKMEEAFAISFSDAPDLAVDEDGEYTSAAVREILSELTELGEFAEDIKVSQGSVGYGADTTVAIVVLTGLASLFFSGKRVEENLDAWIRMGKRFWKAVERLRRRRGGVSVSEPVALALALAKVAESIETDTEVEILGRHCIPVQNASLKPSLEKDFAHQPDRLYVFVLRSSNGDTIVVGLRSDGRTELLHRVRTGSWLEYFGVEPFD